MRVKNNNKDRRVHQRITGGTYAALHQRLGGIVHDQSFSVVLDVSTGGMRVRTNIRPLNQTVMVVRAAVEEEIHTLRSRVLRVERTADGVFDIALEYCFMARDTIDGFLEALGRRDIAVAG